MQLTSPAVSLTDFALAIECTLFAVLLSRRPASDVVLRKWFVTFFASVAVASLLGGTMHGFFEHSTSPIRTALWTGTLLSILLTSYTAWSIAAVIQLDARFGRMVRWFAAVQMIALALVVLFVTQKFLIAIVAYLPATIFLLVAFILAYRRRRVPALGSGVAGLGLVFVGAAVQQLGLALHPVYLDHNTIYHLIQGVALWLIYRAAKWISGAQSPLRSSP
ncbi:MAG TPA: hypothetical protein VNO75_00285 [Gemmatimonadaceae bacterium]|nr:hypothetical protein [Gemmatimonadaceae bacterium]